MCQLIGRKRLNKIQYRINAFTSCLPNLAIEADHIQSAEEARWPKVNATDKNAAVPGSNSAHPQTTANSVRSYWWIFTWKGIVL
jgi:hypothetical protein